MPPSKECCDASTARCNACKQGISEEEYCEANPAALGCEFQADAQTSMFDLDGWTSSDNMLQSTNSIERRQTINALASATTEQELEIAIAEAKAAGVSHIIIQRHQRRLNSMRGDDSETFSSHTTQSTQAQHSSFYSFTGRDCSMLSKIHQQACLSGYTNVRSYCQGHGRTDASCHSINTDYTKKDMDYII